MPDEQPKDKFSDLVERVVVIEQLLGIGKGPTVPMLHPTRKGTREYELELDKQMAIAKDSTHKDYGKACRALVDAGIAVPAAEK